MKGLSFYRSTFRYRDGQDILSPCILALSPFSVAWLDPEYSKPSPRMLRGCPSRVSTQCSYMGLELGESLKKHTLTLFIAPIRNEEIKNDAAELGIRLRW